TQPFTLSVQQSGETALSGELGIQPVVPPNDEYQLYWGFSFGWAAVEGNLSAGLARLTLAIDKPGQAWRQVDAVLLTDNLSYTPIGREKPPFGYLATMKLHPENGAHWRGSAKDLKSGTDWHRPQLGSQDF